MHMIYIYVYTTIYTYIVLCGYVFMSINVYHYIPKKDAHETETFQIPKWPESSPTRWRSSTKRPIFPHISHAIGKHWDGIAASTLADCRCWKQMSWILMVL